MTDPTTPRGGGAVMARRHEPTDSLDDFPTPPWGTRALLAMLDGEGVEVAGTVWEPAANRGYMVRPLAERFARVIGTDIHDYGAGFGLHDFTGGGLLSFGQEGGDAAPHRDAPVDWIVTNPPFVAAEAFLSRALARARTGVALLLRCQALEGVGRYREIYQPRPPRWIFPFVERIAMVRGRCDPDAATMTAYAWFVWLKPAPDLPPRGRAELVWIPPCRLRLERPEDYR